MSKASESDCSMDDQGDNRELRDEEENIPPGGAEPLTGVTTINRRAGEQIGQQETNPNKEAGRKEGCKEARKEGWAVLLMVVSWRQMEG